MTTEELYLQSSDEYRFNTPILKYKLNLSGEIIKKENYINFANNSFPLVSLLLLHNISWLQISIINGESFELNNIANGAHIVTKFLNSHNIDEYKKVKQTLSSLLCANFNTVNIATKPIMMSNDMLYQYYSNPSICHDIHKSFIPLLPKDNKLRKYVDFKDIYVSYMATINISLSSAYEICSECDFNLANRVKLRFSSNADVRVMLRSSEETTQSNAWNILKKDTVPTNTAPYIKNTILTSHVHDNVVNFDRQVNISNNNRLDDLNITVTETIPNYYDLKLIGYNYCIMRLIEVNSTNMKSTDPFDNINSCKVLTEHEFTYHSGTDDIFSSISWSINIPANSKIIINSPYGKLFLNFEQYLADTNKGFEVYPMVIHFNLPDSENFHFYTTETSLLPFPVGDFSMPFNVITLISTIFAFLVGSVANTIVKKKMNK